MRTPALATALTLSLCFAALSQQANGQFLPAVNYPVGASPFGVAVGDFNCDGIPDLAVANVNQALTMARSAFSSATGDGAFKIAVT